METFVERGDGLRLAAARLSHMAHTADELRNYADEHLFYEIWMTSSLVARMERHAVLFDEGLSADRDGPLAEELLELPGRNADIESFATHVRIVLAFLEGRREHGDVIAADYFPKHVWQRPKRPQSLDRVNQRVPVEIGHLSFGRTRRKDKTWPYAQMWRDLAPMIHLFLDNVPEGRVSAEFRREVGKLVPDPPQTTDLVREITLRGMQAGAGAARLDAGFRVTDDSSRPLDSGGTATFPPKLEPPDAGA